MASLSCRELSGTPRRWQVPADSVEKLLAVGFGPIFRVLSPSPEIRLPILGRSERPPLPRGASTGQPLSFSTESANCCRSPSRHSGRSSGGSTRKPAEQPMRTPRPERPLKFRWLNGCNEINKCPSSKMTAGESGGNNFRQMADRATAFDRRSQSEDPTDCSRLEIHH